MSLRYFTSGSCVNKFIMLFIHQVINTVSYIFSGAKGLKYI